MIAKVLSILNLVAMAILIATLHSEGASIFAKTIFEQIYLVGLYMFYVVCLLLLQLVILTFTASKMG